MKKITILLSMLLLTFSGLYAQTVFEFETATDNGDNVTETIDGITVTVTGGTEDLQVVFSGGYGGSTGNTLYQPTNVSSLTFTFSEAVDINSILAMQGNGAPVDYTFTPTGGSNSPVMASVPYNDGISVDLNWTGVTSFTVTTSSEGGSPFTFDALSVSPNTPPTVFDWETVTIQDVGGYNHAFETVDGITVEVSSANNNMSIDTDYGSTYGEFGGVTGNAIYRQAYNTEPVTFTFSEPVDVQSILLLEYAFISDVDFTFSTTDGTNASRMVTTTAASSGIASESPVNLNWVGVTSFTLTPTSGNASPLFDHLTVSKHVPPTVFDWETVTIQDVGGYNHAFETVDGITVEVSSANNNMSIDTDYGSTYGEFGGVTGNAIYRQAYNTEPVTFTFSEPVDVHSILLLEGGFLYDVDFTFSTTDGTNASRMVTTTAASSGIASESPVNLNWVGVTSFTVTPSAPSYVTGTNAGDAAPLFDHLIVSPSTALSVSKVNTFQKAKVYPNPVDNILNIKTVSGLKSATLYNNLGQLVLQSTSKQIDVSHLSKGMYFLQITTSEGIETKKIIKN